MQGVQAQRKCLPDNALKISCALCSNILCASIEQLERCDANGRPRECYGMRTPRSQLWRRGTHSNSLSRGKTQSPSGNSCGKTVRSPNLSWSETHLFRTRNASLSVRARHQALGAGRQHAGPPQRPQRVRGPGRKGGQCARSPTPVCVNLPRLNTDWYRACAG